MAALSLDQRMEDAVAELEKLRALEEFGRWEQQRFKKLDEGLKRFDVAYTAAEARVRMLEQQVAAAAAAPASARHDTISRDEEVRRYLVGFPHVTERFVDKAGKVHAGLKRQADRLTDVALATMKAMKVAPAPAHEDVIGLGAEHEGLREAIAATSHALAEGERALRLQSRDLVWAHEHGWAFVDAMAAPDTQLTDGKDEEKRFKELLEQKRKSEAEAQTAKAAKAGASGKGGGRGNRWGGGRGRGYHEWRERYYDRPDWREDRGHGYGQGGHDHYYQHHGGGRGGPAPPPYGAGRGGRGGR